MIPKNVAEILQNHVLLEVEGIDRMYLNGYVSLVQTEGGAATFIRRQLAHLCEYGLQFSVITAP